MNSELSAALIAEEKALREQLTAMPNIYSLEWQLQQQWETVASSTYRLQVPGGWIYAVDRHKEKAVTPVFDCVFVPRPPHEY